MRGGFDVRDVDELPAGHAQRSALQHRVTSGPACRAAIRLWHEECLGCGYL